MSAASLNKLILTLLLKFVIRHLRFFFVLSTYFSFPEYLFFSEKRNLLNTCQSVKFNLYSLDCELSFIKLFVETCVFLVMIKNDLDLCLIFKRKYFN